MAKRAKPKNERPIIPAVCGFCRSYEVLPDGRGWICHREGYDFRVRDFGADKLAPFRRTCDRFENARG